MNQAHLVNPNSPVFANSYFDGTYDPTQGTVYRTGDVLSNLLDDYTGEEIQYKKVVDPSGITDDGVIYRQLITPENGTEMFKRIFDGKVNIHWFGARGDGVTDDTTAIQKALDLLGIVYNDLQFSSYKIYNFSSKLSILNKEDVVVDFNNCTLFDLGKNSLDSTGATILIPNGILVSTCNSLMFRNLYHDSRITRGVNAIALAEVPNRFPCIDFQNCTNLTVDSAVTKGTAGSFVSPISTTGAFDIMRSSYFRWFNCAEVRIVRCEVATGSGGGEIFSFYQTNDIFFADSTHYQRGANTTVHSFAKIIDCNDVLVQGIRCQSNSTGDFIDYGGIGAIFKDILIDYPNGYFLDITSEWEENVPVLKNITVKDIVTTGDGIVSAGGVNFIPEMENILVDNLTCKSKQDPSTTNINGMQNVREISFNNLNLINIYFPFFYGITSALKEFPHVLHINNASWVCNMLMPASQVVFEINGTNTIRNSVIDMGRVNTLYLRDRYSEYKSVDLTQSHSKFIFENCIFNNTPIRLGANVIFNNCRFYNCKFESMADVPGSAYKIRPTVEYKNCDIVLTSDEPSITSNGLIFGFTNSLNRLTLSNCNISGKSKNASGFNLFNYGVNSSIDIVNSVIEIYRTSENGLEDSAWSAIIGVNNTTSFINLTIQNTKIYNSQFLLTLSGASASDVSSPSTVMIKDIKFITSSQGARLIASVGTSANRININATNFYSEAIVQTIPTDILSLRLIGDYVFSSHPENLVVGDIGSTYMRTTSSDNGVLFTKRISKLNTGWIRTDIPAVSIYVQNTTDILTITFLNTTYPVTTYPIGSIVSYYNQGVVCERVSSTIWQFIELTKAGTTVQRPSTTLVGYRYFDVTLNKSINWNGTVWVDSTGQTV